MKEQEKEVDSGEPDLKKKLKACMESKKFIEIQYNMCEKELRIKTEEVEKMKIEMKDLKEYIKLKDQVNDLRKSKDYGNSMEVEDSNTNKQSEQNTWETRNRKRSKTVHNSSKNNDTKDTLSTDVEVEYCVRQRG